MDPDAELPSLLMIGLASSPGTPRITQGRSALITKSSPLSSDDKNERIQMHMLFSVHICV